MTAEQQFSRMADELDKLVSQQDFSAAADCAARLAAWAQSGASETASMGRAALGAIENARRKICVSRARMADCLVRLERAAEYSTRGAAGVHTWTVEG